MVIRPGRSLYIQRINAIFKAQLKYSNKFDNLISIFYFCNFISEKKVNIFFFNFLSKMFFLIEFFFQKYQSAQNVQVGSAPVN